MDTVVMQIAAYYAAKLARHGATPRGVDWRCQATQEMRFVQLLRLCDFGTHFALDDLGCGYGALLDYLRRAHPCAQIDYLGIEIAAPMVSAASKRHSQSGGARFLIGSSSPRVADYAVASGIMNVKLLHSDEVWEDFVAATLRGMAHHTRLGFAVNFMAEAPSGAVEPRLYRTRPSRWAALCSDELDCSVEILTGYGLREFTLLASHRNAG